MSPMLRAVSLLAVIILVVLTAACGGGNNGGGEGSGSGNVVTIKFANFSSSGDNAKYLTRMKEAFEKANPTIKVDIETIAYGDYFTQLQTRVAAGTAPDAYELNYENFVSYAKKGVLLDLEPYFDSSGFDRSTLNAQALGAFRADGVQYGMPASFSNVVLIYNKELFDRANVSYPSSSWTWSDMNDAAARIRALGDDIFGIYQPIQFHEFFKTVQQNGGSLLNDDLTEFTVDRPENVETLRHLSDRVVKSNIMPTAAQLSGMGDWDLFKAGRLGMIITGVWAFSDFVKNVDFEWDIEVEPGNKRKATHFFSNGLVINGKTKHAAAAFEWIKFMSASKEAAQIRVEANWELPAVTDPEVLESYLSISPPANRQAVFHSLDYLVTPPVIEQFNEMADILGIHLQAAVEGVKTPEKALADAQKELEQKISLK